MTLRKPTAADASSIAAISIEVWIGTYLKLGVNSFFADFALREFTPEKIEAHLLDPNQFILVSQNDEGIDGFIRVSRSSEAPVPGCSGSEIATFYVQPRHHGKGIGTRLLGAALQYCRDTQATSAWLTTNAENKPAIDFYLAQGFELVGETYFRIHDQKYLNKVLSIQLI